MDSDVRESLVRLVAYTLEGERRDYEESIANGDIEEGDPEHSHIYSHAVALDEWLHKYTAISARLASSRMLFPTDLWCQLMDSYCESLRSLDPRFDERAFREDCYREVHDA